MRLPDRPARTTGPRRRPQPPPTALPAETPAQPLYDLPFPTPTRPHAADSPGSVPGSQCDPISQPIPASCPASPDLTAPLRRCPPPASYWTPPATGQSGISAATSDCHAAPISCKSGWPGSHPPSPPAAQKDRPAASPRPDCAPKKGTDRPTAAALHRFPDHPAEPADTRPKPPQSCPSAKASPRAPHACQSRLGPVVLTSQP